MKKNIVLIETVETMGTGVLYPCKYDEDGETRGGCNSFIIFTNHHVLGALGEDTKPCEDIRNSIILQIFDDAGSCIDGSDIKRVLICNPAGDRDQHDDIAALLVCIDRNRTISVETHVCQEEPNNRDILYMEGYPGIMADDEVSQKVQLEGMAKNIFPENHKIGVYQIRDDYHWYNDFKDLKLMQGFSGSPVYTERENMSYLMGINQSIADTGGGENPFKLVYYLKIKYVLEYLRRCGCVLFRRDSQDTYEIQWVYGAEQKTQAYKNNPTFLLIGGSGAGKSSFAKDFAYNGKKLHTTNDGQTTRTNVIYEYSIFNQQSAAEIKFMNQEKFQDYLQKLNGVKPILFFYQRLFGLESGNDPKTKLEYLINSYYLLEYIKSNGKKKLSNTLLGSLDRIEDILMVFQHSEAGVKDEELFGIYENVMEVLLSEIPVKEIKFICDKNKIQKIRERCSLKFEYERTVNQTEPDEEMKKTIFRDMIRKEWPEADKSFLKSILMEYCTQTEEMKYKDYQEKCYEHIKNDYPGTLKGMERENASVVQALASNMEFRQDLFNLLFYAEGFFDIREFGFFLSIEDIKKHICKLIPVWTEYAEGGQKNTYRKDIEIESALKNLYKEAHKLIRDGLVRKLGINDNLSQRISLDLADQEEERLLTWCVQESNGKSLTGIVDYVKIEDRISDEYAMLLYDLNISKLRILDTYGLDHVEGEQKTRDVLHDIVYKYQEDIKLNFEDIFVIYLKKLDSGRPDELRSILLCVWEVIPQTSVYCVFTGIDIFYGDLQGGFAPVKWSKSNEKNCPKSVRYLLSHKGKEEITRNVIYSKERKEYLYLVLRNNLIPYCGRKDLVETNYSYYDNNYSYMRKLLSSIILKESNSLEIMDVKETGKTLEGNKQVVEQLLDKLFERASVRIWNFHHMTVKANYNRLTDRKNNRKLGFWRTYRHQWNQLFHEAYSYVIREESQELIGLFHKEKAAVEATLANMETKFLGDSENLYKMNLKNEDKNEFRLLLEEMYGYQEVYRTGNPFKSEYLKEYDWNGTGQNAGDQESRKRFLSDIVDFAKGFRRIPVIREKFIDLFIAVFVKQVDEDNHTKARNLVSLNPFFSDALEHLEREFMDKYSGNDRGEAKEKFRTILNFYLECR